MWTVFFLIVVFLVGVIFAAWRLTNLGWKGTLEGVSNIAKSCFLCFLVAAFLGASGCAALNYPKYADKQAEVYKSQADAKKEVAKALAVGVGSNDQRTQTMASMALFAMALTDKPYQIEGPREGIIERSIGMGLTMLPMAWMGVEIAKTVGDSAGHSTTINASGTGQTAINTGGGSAGASYSSTATDRHDIADSYNSTDNHATTP